MLAGHHGEGRIERHYTFLIFLRHLLRMSDRRCLTKFHHLCSTFVLFFFFFFHRIEAGLSAGDTLTFEVSNNFIVDYYDGTKSIVVSNTNDLGGRNLYWGQSLPTIGGVVLFLALLIAVSADVLRPSNMPSICRSEFGPEWIVPLGDQADEYPPPSLLLSTSFARHTIDLFRSRTHAMDLVSLAFLAFFCMLLVFLYASPSLARHDFCLDVFFSPPRSAGERAGVAKKDGRHLQALLDA